MNRSTLIRTEEAKQNNDKKDISYKGYDRFWYEPGTTKVHYLFFQMMPSDLAQLLGFP